MALPKQQQAAVRQGQGPRCEITTIDVPQLGPGQILCKINYSGICATDKSFIYDEFKMKETAKGIAGHEGAGIVVAVAEDVKDLWKEGDRVGVKWVTSVCRKCEFCNNGTDELQCTKKQTSGNSVPGKRIAASFSGHC